MLAEIELLMSNGSENCLMRTLVSALQGVRLREGFQEMRLK